MRDEAIRFSDMTTAEADAIIVARDIDLHRVARLRSTSFGRPILLEIDEVETADAALLHWLPAWPDGIVLRRCRSAFDVQHLSAKLAVREADADVPHGTTVVIAMAGSSASSLLDIASFRDAGARLIGLGWDDCDLAADLGAEPATFAATDLWRSARSTVALGAAAAGVLALDTAHSEAACQLGPRCVQARALGFAAKIAGSAGETATINEALRRGPIGA